KGRGHVMTPSPVRVWADANQIGVLTPMTLSEKTFLDALRAVEPDVFVVVDYGKILPASLLAIPPKGTLNMHPSLLPRHRGPAPGESQILTEANGENVGVSVMLLDEKMDHGPVLAQKNAFPEVTADWPMRASRLYPILAREGGLLLTETLLRWASGEAVPQEQDHAHATYCTKIRKEDALLDLSGDPEANYRKFLAYDRWPRAYFFRDRGGIKERVIITDAELRDDTFIVKKVIPEGKKEMAYETFLRSR
ncbi:MAG TPA: methionyl-tRNA formyltransferase, partial [Candidatus Paceibacterota bacterium]|nr:methionyl-tRNA formyltransferase [Candidatus Paceibacterota bacterium]